MAEHTITLSLISHTNVGKTTLARTLLRRDVGDAVDQAHVTDVNESYTLTETGDTELRLWDTPGFGDSARLVKRLKISQNPLGWMLSQVWDRFTDRAMWCSQQAVKNVREEADVVLYLVNASEDPLSATYVDMEMEVLTWIGKPVLLLLNQTGPGRGREAEEADEQVWRDHLKEVPVVKAVVGLDAFARCWVQEGELLAKIRPLLPGDKQDRFDAVQAAWKRENLDVFHKAMGVLGRQLAESAGDAEKVSEETMLQKFGLNRYERNKELTEARKGLAERLASRSREAVNSLIVIHSLEGQTERGAGTFNRDSFGVPEKVNESIWSAVGGAGAGLTTGLAADMLAGGATFFGGAVIGVLAGGAGGYFMAKGFNLAKGTDNRVRWSEEHFLEQVQLVLLVYLAVAHFGRGRGAWEDSEYPSYWRTEAKEAAGVEEEKIRKLWKEAGSSKANAESLREELEALLTRCVEKILTGLYPDSDVFN